MNQIRFAAIAMILLLSAGDAFSQIKKHVTLEDVFKSDVFSQKAVYGINWMRDGKYYSSLRRDVTGPKVVKVNVATGDEEAVLIDGGALGINFSSYAFNPDETKALIASEVESIYRRSSKGIFHVIDIQTSQAQKLMDGEKIMYATLSPDNDKVAFVKDNDLYYVNLSDNQVKRITQDGEWNKIINGAADWVYEEEFSMSRAFEWSPDGSKLAFIRFDESEVPEFNMQTWGKLYPEDYKFKYPKAGEKNALVSIHIHDLNNGNTVKVDAGDDEDIYLPRIYWTGNSDKLAYIRLNRLQNQLDLFYSNSTSGESQLVLQEKSDTYVDLNYNDDLRFLEDGSGFIRTSEQDGFKHVYHHGNDGKLIRQITKGNWEVTNLVAVDEKAKKLYYISTEKSPLERNFYVIGLDGKGKKILAGNNGTYRINMSKDKKYYIADFTNAETPLKVTLHEASGKEVKVLEDNQVLRENVNKYAIGKKEFFQFETVDGTSLNGYILKPENFEESKKYPVLMYVYGGPGSQTVTNSWGGSRDFWHQHLAQEGYLIVSVDNRGTGARGKDFKHMTYANLGKYEVEDQIAGAKYLATLPYVDSSRIGIWGWSYGGYMSSLGLMVGSDVFKTAIAVAPVTTWRYYDTIYTERYLQTPQVNAAGYDDNSPITHVNKLKGNLMLIHGTGDDNVHFQNAVDLADALIKADKQFETMFYPNRNHGIYGGNTTWHLYSLMTDFIKRKL
ncbi:Dipeptidyl peptidase IV [Indibacter alkaliphilus LW1]|uniref:Dipeptidyl peptidase IV n=1 Tax=Indibacter alkaliphilus (strain CCUG 57479 / KCTC 22604 / LW1) TaxID=1189612 RepID=S2DC88_INDAL|nr:S9 family peptidase [Indibacter alkaliphilus]EOZ96524.1 Dipeptidyl peptidase IV [Indibacter alkaliphilus LW1]